MLEYLGAIKTAWDLGKDIVTLRRWKKGKSQLSEPQRQRRREVREKLVQFNELVYKVGRGAWPGAGEAAQPHWEKLLGRVTVLKSAVVQALDVDRETAGHDWCHEVEDCLDKGWRLVHNCYGHCMPGLPPGTRKQVGDEHLAIRDAYEAAYKKVL